MKFSLLSVLLQTVHSSQNMDMVTFENLINNSNCNRDCIDYGLNYFPHHSILEKCGCINNNSDKFLLNKND